MSRWTAKVIYRSDSGIVDVIHDIDEISELDALVEHGPHFDAIEEISIRRGDGDKLTIEQAEKM